MAKIVPVQAETETETVYRSGVAVRVPRQGVQAEPETNPFLTRTLLPGFAELQGTLTGGTDSTELVSDMRDEEQ